MRKISDYEIEILEIILIFLIIGVAIGFSFNELNDDIKILNFKMNQRQFEGIVKTMGTEVPTVICELKGEDCIAFVTLKKYLTKEQIEQTQEQYQKNMGDLGNG